MPAAEQSRPVLFPGRSVRVAAAILWIFGIPFARAADKPRTGMVSATQQGELSSLLSALAAKNSTVEDRRKIAARILEIGPPGPEKLAAAVEKQTALLDKDYRRAFLAEADRLRMKKMKDAGASFNGEVKASRQAVLSIREDKILSPAMILKQADPAMRKLEALLAVSRQDVLAASEALRKQRQDLLDWDALKPLSPAGENPPAASGNPSAKPSALEAALEDYEDLAAVMALPTSLTARRTLEANFVLAGQIHPEEARCIQDVNRIRALLGLRVLKTDLKLCQAARDHSKDMVTHKFFNHISPLPGKTKFSDRAKLAETTACAENIHYGTHKGVEANVAWFHSPAHFHVMLHDIHVRIGAGVHEGMWTQMFGY